MNETREEIQDTIDVCQSYIDDAAANAESHLFDPAAVDFARKQIAFENKKIDMLDAIDLLRECARTSHRRNDARLLQEAAVRVEKDLHAGRI